MAEKIGDALIRIIIDPDSALAGVQAKGDRRARPVEKSKDPAKRSGGKGSENPDWLEEDVILDRVDGKTIEASKESEASYRQWRAERREAAREARKRQQEKAKDLKEKERVAKQRAREALRQKAARRAIAGRGTRRVLNRTVPTVGRAGTIGIQTAQTVAPAVGLKAAGGIGMAAGGVAAVGAGLINYGFQAGQFVQGGTGLPVEDLMVSAINFGTLPGLLGQAMGIDVGQAVTEFSRDAFDTMFTIGDVYGAVRRSLVSSGVVATLGGASLDGEEEKEYAYRAGRAAYLRSMYEKGLDRRLGGLAAKGVGSAVSSLLQQNLRTHQQR